MFGTCGECGLDMSYLECGTCPSCGSDDYFMGSYTEGDNSGRCYACGETHANAIQWVAELEPEPLRIHSAGLFPYENDEADAMDADDAGDSADR